MLTDSLKHQWTDRALDLGRSTKINELWHQFSDKLPKPLRQRVRKLVARSHYGTSLVPAAELEQCYVNAIETLLELVGPQGLGDYLEFGVCRGTSMSCMHRALAGAGASRTRLFGFDSFEGLPAIAAEDDGGLWPPGAFDSDIDFTKALLTRAGVDWTRTFLVKGWFSDTLTEKLVQEQQIEKASLIMVDSDIYTSAKEALSFCAPLIKDQSVIFFDDWNSGALAERNLGEKKAFDEFLAEHPEFIAEPLPAYSEGSAVFLVTRVDA